MKPPSAPVQTFIASLLFRPGLDHEPNRVRFHLKVEAVAERDPAQRLRVASLDVTGGDLYANSASLGCG